MNYILFAVLVLFNIMDIHYTKQALDLGIPEANPMMDYIIQNLGITGMIVVKGFLLGVLAILIPYAVKSWTLILMGVVCMAYGWVVLNHLVYLGG